MRTYFKVTASRIVGPPPIPPSVPNQTLNFGALTLANAGGAKALDSNGSEVSFVSVDSVTSGDGSGWAVSNGRLIRTTATPASSNGAVLACTTDLGATSITIDAIPNEYSVLTRAEQLAVKVLGAATYSGKTMRLRNTGDHVGDGSAIDWTGQTPAAQFLITSDTYRMPLVPGYLVGNSSNIKFYSLSIYRPFQVGDTTTTCVINVNSAANIIVDDCEVSSNDLSTVFMQQNPEVLYLVGHSDGSTANGIEVTNSNLHDCRIPVRFSGTDNKYINNDVLNCFENFGIFIGTMDRLEVKLNRCLGIWARGGGIGNVGPNNPTGDPTLYPYDYGDPHSSLLSFQPGSHDTDTMIIQGNMFLEGTNRYDVRGDYHAFATGMKLNATGPGGVYGHYSNTILRNNIFACDGNVALEWGYVDPDSEATWNTFICPDDIFTGTQGVPQLQYYQNGAGVIIANNTAGSYAATGPNDPTIVVSNNSTIVRGDYATEYDGPSFTGVTPDTVLTIFNPKAGGSLLTATPKQGAIGTGYFDWSTGVGTWPGGDVTPPVLSGPSGSMTSGTTATLAVNTDTGEGLMYAVVTTSAIKPSADQVIAGENDSGSAAEYADNQPVSAVGTETFSATGLSGSPLYGYFCQTDAAGNKSLVAETGAMTALAAGFIARTNDNSNKTSGSLYTVTGLSIGTPDAKRVVIIGIESSVQLSSVTLGGVAMTAGPINGGPTSSCIQFWYLATSGGVLDTATTATLVAANASGTTASRFEVSIYVCYPASAVPVDSDNVSATSGTPAVINDLAVATGGFVATLSECNSSSPSTVTWTGTDPVVEDYDLATESGSPFVAGNHIAINQTSSTLDLTLTADIAGTKKLVAISFGA